MFGFAEILLLSSLPLLLLASGFFSGSETAFFSLTRHQQLQMSRSGTPAGAMVTALLLETRALLITLLMTNTTINVSYFVVSTVLLLRTREAFHPMVLAGASAGSVMALILVGEVIPKLIAARLAVGWSRMGSWPLMMVHRALAPLRVVMSAAVISPLARLISPVDRPPELSPEEMEVLLELSRTRGVIDDHEERLLQEVLELSQLKVRDLMTPRVDIQAFDLSAPPQALMTLIQTTGLHHIPIYRDDLDHIEGVVHAREVLLKRPTSTATLNRLIRQVNFAPELQRADQLLAQFRKRGTTLAIAVDEYGGTAGLITLEDVVEQMVGQIAGPHEQPKEPEVQQLHPGRWRVEANLPIHVWGDAFRGTAVLPGVDGFFDTIRRTREGGISTIGGLVMARLGRLPQEGDRTTVGNVMIQVDQMHGRRIRWLTVQLVTPPDEDCDLDVPPPGPKSAAASKGEKP